MLGPNKNPRKNPFFEGRLSEFAHFRAGFLLVIILKENYLFLIKNSYQQEPGSKMSEFAKASFKRRVLGRVLVGPQQEPDVFRQAHEARGAGARALAYS